MSMFVFHRRIPAIICPNIVDTHFEKHKHPFCVGRNAEPPLDHPLVSLHQLFLCSLVPFLLRIFLDNNVKHLFLGANSFVEYTHTCIND